VKRDRRSPLSPQEQTIARKLRVGALEASIDQELAHELADLVGPPERAGEAPAAVGPGAPVAGAELNRRDRSEPADRQVSGPEEGGP
jgi:hypothetical protein